MKYKTLSRESCERYCSQKHKQTSVIISIRSSWDRVLPKLSCTEENGVKDILFLSFDDIDEWHCIEKSFRKGLITESDAKQVVDFTEKWYGKVDMIIVHCDGGISRSAGVCSAIMRWYEINDSLYFWSKSKFPNMTCYLRVLDAYRGIKNVPFSKNSSLQRGE